MRSLYLYAGIAILTAAVIGAAGVAIARYGTGRYEAGRAVVLADDARAAEQLHQQQDRLAALSAFAGLDLQQHLDTQLPAIQGQTHDAVETIRTVYRDRPVPAGAAASCSRPDGVQQVLDAAVQRANAAASGHL